jgi:hypothetical protein
MRTSTVLIGFVLAVVLGLILFGFLARRAVTLEQAAPAQALRAFTAVRDSLGPAEPMLRLGTSGRAQGRPPVAEGSRRPVRLHVLAYRAREQRLVRAEVPFWFFKLKGPAVQFALRGTNVDLKELGLTPGDLERHGPGLVLDESPPGGDRFLIWTD